MNIYINMLFRPMASVSADSLLDKIIIIIIIEIINYIAETKNRRCIVCAN